MHIYNIDGHEIIIRDDVFEEHKEKKGYYANYNDIDLYASIIINKYKKNIEMTDNDLSEKVNELILKDIGDYVEIPSHLLRF